MDTMAPKVDRFNMPNTIQQNILKENGTRTSFSPITLVFPCQYHSTNG